MRAGASILFAGVVAATWACVGELSMTPPGESPDAGPAAADAAPTGFDELDPARAQARFVTTTDLMRYVFAPGCAAETNECHSNEDFPDLHTEGNLWNLVDLRCNVGVGERSTIEDFCEAEGDQLRITTGGNAGFTARVGAIDVVLDEAGEFVRYDIVLDTAVPQTDSGDFELVRAGNVMPALGSGTLDAAAGAATVSIADVDGLADPSLVQQGDENRNGVFGNGGGVLVKAGDARASYLVKRLLEAETTRVRMPLDENADNPNEQNRRLSADEMYAIMSWINCMQPGDGVYSPVRYDCAANAGNEGRW